MTDDVIDKAVLTTGDTEEERQATIEMFGFQTDAAGYICTMDGERVIDPYQDTVIHRDSFAIVPPATDEQEAKYGSVLFLQSDEYSLTTHLAREME